MQATTLKFYTFTLCTYHNIMGSTLYLSAFLATADATQAYIDLYRSIWGDLNWVKLSPNINGKACHELPSTRVDQVRLIVPIALVMTHIDVCHD